MDAEELIAEKNEWYEWIQEKKLDLADLKRKRAKMKAPLWEEATGTVDAKKDFIKSQISDIEYKIASCEANIEYHYNMIDIINDKLAYCCDLIE